mmetsp:Transcript_40087/g.87552  ORF Transcript_40087/g.87552 Transcript_40087/m.87552 type:complete len:480 (-) Transcript_40087:86-1525(-)|eukprot:CAMPEP_0170599202 /NCGR_PEP_ID=MMETSP0224-20130122/16667_1 /TAXON_ID=285029 /ORGANISM="Togula jolla, Strain CCCM 725" /LENGTH=479 /DNA_ID=CAMNT_0010923829 /DNA_START=67 /DNA_END=1506 /DNA_ORIENTATION=-
MMGQMSHWDLPGRHGDDGQEQGLSERASPQAVADVTAGTNEPQLTFSLAITRQPGTSLGIDVTYSSAAAWTRNGVFVARIFKDGLVAAWNSKSKEPRLIRPGDFIFQVNDVHGDTVNMIKEMKSEQQLTIHVLRRATTTGNPGATPDPSAPLRVGQAPAGEISSGPTRNGSPGLQRPEVESLLRQLGALGDEALAGFICVVLERRPWLRDAVFGGLGDEENDAISGPPGGLESLQAGVSFEQQGQEAGEEAEEQEVQFQAETEGVDGEPGEAADGAESAEVPSTELWAQIATEALKADDEDGAEVETEIKADDEAQAPAQAQTETEVEITEKEAEPNASASPAEENSGEEALAVEESCKDEPVAATDATEGAPRGEAEEEASVPPKEGEAQEDEEDSEKEEEKEESGVEGLEEKESAPPTQDTQDADRDHEEHIANVERLVKEDDEDEEEESPKAIEKGAKVEEEVDEVEERRNEGGSS